MKIGARSVSMSVREFWKVVETVVSQRMQVGLLVRVIGVMCK